MTLARARERARPREMGRRGEEREVVMKEWWRSNCVSGEHMHQRCDVCGAKWTTGVLG